MITLQQLKSLKDNQIVRYRIGRTYELRDEGRVDWESWKTGSLYVRRTEKAYKKRPAGTIITICPRNESGSAEYNPEHDFVEESGIFDCEDYVFEIDGSSL